LGCESSKTEKYSFSSKYYGKDRKKSTQIQGEPSCRDKKLANKPNTARKLLKKGAFIRNFRGFMPFQEQKQLIHEKDIQKIA
jgi:hypothetical protein